MDRILEVNQINALYRGQTVKVKGFIKLLRSEIMFAFIDSSIYNKEHKEITCVCESTRDIQLTTAIVEGEYLSNDHQDNNFYLPPYFQVKSIQYINDQENIDITNEFRETFFTNENLENLKFETSKELIKNLNEHAQREGFQLTHKKSLSSKSITLLCDQHSKYKKKHELNTGCDFKISICFSKSLGGYHVTSINNVHNHYLCPQLFTHKLLDVKIIEQIKSMLCASVSLWQIADVIQALFKVNLSIEQLRVICKKFRKKIIKTETDDLFEYMKTTNGKAIIYQTKRKNIIRRQAIATFTQDELENLATYGDFIAIDPTFAPLSTNWSIIPLTVINSERKIQSAGIVFASHNKAAIFKWILELLVLKLPCKNIIQTVCSDDDLALNSAFNMILEEDENSNKYEEEDEDDDDDDDNVFNNTDPSINLENKNDMDEENDLDQSDNEDKNSEELKQKIEAIGRVVCFWHKISNFKKFIQTVKIELEQKEKAIKCFKRIGMSRDIKYVDLAINELKEIDDKIRIYFEQNVEPKLKYMAKSYLRNTFTCGYITSSIAESANNKLKSHLNNSSMTLVEMRKRVDSIQLHDKINDYYIKIRKPHKAKNPLIIDLMANLKISNIIAEAIIGSIEKVPKLTLIKKDNSYDIIENITNELGEFDHQEIFEVNDKICSCNKFYQTGIPCSHLLKVLEFENEEISITPDMIHKRWITNKFNLPFDFSLNDIDKVRISKTQNAGKLIKSTTGRYTYIMSQFQMIANIGSRSQTNFNKVTKILDKLQTDLEFDEDPKIIEEKGVRPGRKKSKRIKSTS